MELGTLVSLLAAMGFGTIVAALISNISEWLKGRKGDERSAWADRDKEARARRKLEDTLHKTRRLAMDRGIPETDLPAWPDY